MRDYLPLSFADDLEQHARFYRNDPAYTLGEKSISHGELLSSAKLIGSALHNAGLRHQDRVGILSMNSIELAKSWLPRNGPAISSHPSISGWPRLRSPALSLMARLGCSFSKRSIYRSWSSCAMKCRRWRPLSASMARATGQSTMKSFIATGDPLGPPIRATEEDICCLIYTSGTTGKPKGVIWGHREYRQLVQVDTWLIDMQQPDVTLIVMPMFHLGGMVISLSQHVRGGAAYLQRQFEPLDVLKAIEKERLSILLLAPTMVQMVLEHPYVTQADLSSVRTIIYSAAPMPVPVLKKAIDVFNGCRLRQPVRPE